MPLGQFDEAAACCIAHEALSGIAQCHARGIAHLDIKPANFLFLDPSSSRMRMIDFGLAAYCSPGQILTEKVGSFPYISPDVLRQAYGLPSDLWSYGVVLFECLSGRLPFKSEDEDYLTCDSKLRSKDWSIAITSGTLGWDDAGLSSDALDLLQRLLTRDPNKRISGKLNQIYALCLYLSP